MIQSRSNSQAQRLKWWVCQQRSLDRRLDPSPRIHLQPACSLQCGSSGVANSSLLPDAAANEETAKSQPTAMKAKHTEHLNDEDYKEECTHHTTRSGSMASPGCVGGCAVVLCYGRLIKVLLLLVTKLTKSGTFFSWHQK